MKGRWNFGALLVLLMLHLLNFKCLSHNFEANYSYARKVLDEIPLHPPKTGSIPATIDSKLTKHNINSTETTNINATSQISPVPAPIKHQNDPTQNDSNKGLSKWVYFVIIFASVFLVGTVICTVLICKKKGVVSQIGPWRTGISGQLQKAFVSGVPRLNYVELEAACEGFSNIIITSHEYSVFKGTLSSGVEISVSCSAINSKNDWSKHSELCFRKKIEMLTRINHKNFVNLLGFCEEEEPFTRIMIFEYAPNGPLYEHLHLEETEHLDWSARMRIIMGIAYCLQYLHELEPSISHPDLCSSSVFLTEDFAAKVGDASVWREVMRKETKNGDGNFDLIESKSADVASNIYSFGIILSEIITGRDPYSKEGSLLDMLLEIINEEINIAQLIDPALKAYKTEDLNVICEVIKACVQIDAERRPKMREITAKLRDVLAISPEAANPRLSPLWWAELEILSV
ncbi:hypothetical protein LUZ60_001122 [Juncus effusus]|nr:hypothetical protein LUZ60_001122 [Juncus effusus]